MPTNEIETLIDRLDSAQFDVSLLLLRSRQALRQAAEAKQDAEARAEAARAQVTEVTAECDRLRDINSRWYHGAAAQSTPDATPVPPENNPKP